MLIVLRQLSGTRDLVTLGEDLFSLLLWKILTAVADVRLSVDVGANWFRSAIVVRLLYSHPISMCLGTWISWLKMLVSSTWKGTLGFISIIPFSGSIWRWSKAKFGSNRKRTLAEETTVTEAAFYGFNSNRLATLTLTFSTVTWMESRLSIGTTLLTVFKYKDKVAIGHQVRWITSILCGIIASTCSSVNSNPSKTSTVRVSATRNLYHTCNYPIVTWSFSDPKIRMLSSVADAGSIENVFLKKRSQPVCRNVPSCTSVCLCSRGKKTEW